MTVEDWTRSEAWDVVHLGGKRMPGVARVDVELGGGLDVQKPRGAKKARVVDDGVPPATLTIRLQLLPADMADLQAVIPTLRPRGKTAGQKPLEIVHPNAALWGIANVKIDDISSPSPADGGSYVLTIKAVEWVPEPAKVKKVEEKPAGDADVQPLIDALNTSPSASGAAEELFSSADTPAGSGF